MNANSESARDDLAFLRAIVEERQPGLRSGGVLYAAAGVIYGVQTLVLALQLSGAVAFGDGVHGWAPLVANALFFAVMGWTLWRNRADMKIKGAASRAISMSFAGVGIANGTAAIAFAIAAAQFQSSDAWLLFPIVVCAFQGAAWFIFASITRRVWIGVIAAGWYVAAAALGALVGSLALYLFALSFVLFALMAAPGFFLMRVSADGE